MTVASQSGWNTENPFAWPFGISAGAIILLLAALLSVFGVSLLPPALVIGAVALLWLLFRHPVGSLGAILAFMPFLPVTILLVVFFGVLHITLVSAYMSAGLLLLMCVLVLWRRNGITPTVPDWFLLACFGLAVMRLAFSGTLIALMNDFNFIIAYLAGRVTVLTASQEKLWARRAVWIVAVLSVLGLSEVLVFGSGPRTLLYLAVAPEQTMDGALGPPFHAEGFSGLRESATMVGPLQFASLCMAALIAWWVYCRNPLPGGMIAIGLICSLTRSAWFGTVVAIPLLAVVMEQKKRLFLYVALAAALFIASVPVLGLSDYLFSTRTGQDPSAQGHEESIFQGLEYVSVHALGVGPGNVGKYAVQANSNAVGIENTYLTLAAEYGVLTAFCFVGFLLFTLRVLWRERTQLSYAAVGIAAGFGAVMMFAALHDVFPLAAWLWFPVGLAVRFSTARREDVLLA